LKKAGLQTDRGLVTLGPAAPVDINHDRRSSGCVREVKIELLERVITVGEVLLERAGGDDEGK
jgi:methyl coenzyme M reductase subunit D